MIWVAVVVVCILIILQVFLYRRDKKSMGINAFFSVLTLLMAITYSTHAWQQMHPLAAWYTMFVPASHWMFNFF